MWGRLGNCPDTHFSPTWTEWLSHYCWVSSLVFTVIPPSFSTGARARVCVSLQYSSMFVIAYSKMGGDCSFTHTRSYWDHGTDGGGERWGSTQSAGRVCGAIGALTFYNLRLQTSGQNAPLVSIPIDLLDRKWPFKGFSFFFLFSSRPHASTLRSSWSGLFYCGQ